MNDLVYKLLRSPARANLDHLDPAELGRYRRANTIVSDPERRRPRYFDGRFLAAQDLTREQSYFLERQADLARASTPGVIHGLQVSRVDNTIVRITPGNGVTPAGQLVVLSSTLDVDLADVPAMQRLDAAFGLDTIPNEPPRRRSGLFVLALRPVEYTANPTAAYPASITERRSVEDGEIIEAVAVTLVPYPDDQSDLDSQQQRARVAYRLFIERRSGAVPAEALPLAMIALDRGFLTWIDAYLVRREVGPEHGGVARFGPIPRSVREAQVQQYVRHLDDLIAARVDSGSPVAARFAAAEVFRTLPPAGLMPIETVDRVDVLRYMQAFFPPQVHVLMSLVPEDEIAAQVEDSMLLPPIDLTATPDELGFTWVLVLLPARRADLFVPRLIRAVELLPAAPGIATRGAPLRALGGFSSELLPSSPPTVPSARDAENERVLREIFTAARGAGDRLWYVRRRALRIRPERRYEVQAIDVGYVSGIPT